MKGRFTRPRCYREWHRSAVGCTAIVLMEVNIMKKELIAFLDTRPEDELAKILNWACVLANALGDRTPYEERTRKTIYTAIFYLEKPE